MNEITLLFNQSRGIIDPNLYGHFSEHIGGVFYDGLWVGEDSPVENIHGFRKKLVDSFKKINPPVLRWPGGCFAETYDWRDGIGPRASRPRRVNFWYNRDGRIESNQVGTHEFMDFCSLVGAEPYVAANMTAVPALHIRNWIEYCNAPAHLTTFADERAANGHVEPFHVRYWGIGNENWGGGGRMSAEMCAREYLRFRETCSTVTFAKEPSEVQFVACGPNAHDVSWTRELMQTLHSKDYAPSALSVHYYCGTAGKPQEFTEEEWYRLLHQANYMQNIVDDHRAAMDEFDPCRRTKLYVDEWGCWHAEGTGPSHGCNLFEQQSNMRDAVVTALTLNLFNDRCDVVGMANVAQLCNNLHALFLAGGDNFVETPTYHVFDFYKTHQGGRQLGIVNTCGQFAPIEMQNRVSRPLDKVSASASQASDGTVTVTLANTSVTEAVSVTLNALGGSLTGKVTVKTLYASDPHTCNTFEEPCAVCPTEKELSFTDGDSLTLPAASVTAVVFRS